MPAKAGPKPNAFGFAAGAKKATPPTSVFGHHDDDDDHPVTQPIASTSSGSGKAKVSTATLSRAQKAKQAEELLLDQTVYEYDEVYDNMKEGSRAAQQASKKDAGDRKVSCIVYIELCSRWAGLTGACEWRSPNTWPG